MTIPYLQRPWNLFTTPLKPIYNALEADKNVEETTVFLTRRVFISMSVSNVSYNQKFENHFYRETTNENKQFKETKHLYLIRQSFLCKSGIAILRLLYL